MRAPLRFLRCLLLILAFQLFSFSAFADLTLTPSITLVSSSGTVATDARNVEFIFSSDFTGTVLGVAYAGATDVSQRFEAPAGAKLAAIAYTVTAGSIRIVVVR